MIWWRVVKLFEQCGTFQLNYREPQEIDTGRTYTFTPDYLNFLSKRNLMKKHIEDKEDNEG